MAKVQAVRKDNTTIVLYIVDGKTVSFEFSKVGSFIYNTEEPNEEVLALVKDQSNLIYLTEGEQRAIDTLGRKYAQIEFPSKSNLMDSSELPPPLLHASVNFIK